MPRCPAQLGQPRSSASRSRRGPRRPRRRSPDARDRALKRTALTCCSSAADAQRPSAALASQTRTTPSPPAVATWRAVRAEVDSRQHRGTRRSTVGRAAREVPDADRAVVARAHRAAYRRRRTGPTRRDRRDRAAPCRRPRRSTGEHANGAVEARDDELGAVGAELHPGGVVAGESRECRASPGRATSQTAITPSSPALATCAAVGREARAERPVRGAHRLDQRGARCRRPRSRTAPSRPAVDDLAAVGARLDGVDPVARAPATTASAREASVAWRSTFCACSVSRRSSARSASVRLSPGSTSRKLVALAASSRDAAMSRWRSASRPCESATTATAEIATSAGRQRGERRRDPAAARRALALPARLRSASRNARSSSFERGIAALRATRWPRRAARRGTARRRRGRGRATPARRRSGSAGSAGSSRSSSIQSRSRGHSRSSASCATSTLPALTVRSRASASSSITPRRRPSPVASSSASASRRRSTRALRLPLDQPQQHAARHGLLRRVEPAERVLGEPRDGAAHAARLARRSRAAGARPSRRCHSSSSAVDSSGSAPGSSLDVGHERVGELGLDARARRAARDPRSRGGARRGASRRPARGWRRAAGRARGTRRSARRSRRAARRPRTRRRRACARRDELGRERGCARARRGRR